ncbi:hypothetical protein ACTXT7_011762 [Hymenolepis weldensis]
MLSELILLLEFSTEKYLNLTGKAPKVFLLTASIGTVTKVAALSYHQDFMRSQIKVPWSHIDLSLTEPIQATSYLILICRQPLVDPIDTKCGHTFCTPCLKSHLVVQALCPEDKQIINYLECQQSSNLVKRHLKMFGEMWRIDFLEFLSIMPCHAMPYKNTLSIPPLTMKHKPQITTDLDDFESLLQETSNVVSNGGDTRGSSPVNAPFKEKAPTWTCTEANSLVSSIVLVLVIDVTIFILDEASSKNEDVSYFVIFLTLLNNA